MLFGIPSVASLSSDPTTSDMLQDANDDISIDNIPESVPRFAIIMDAGSTGTRVHIYSWDVNHPFSSLREVASTKARIGMRAFE